MSKAKRKYTRYGGDPLVYFKAHPGKFEGLGRTWLSSESPGMYKALVRCGKLELAIPDADDGCVERGRWVGKRNFPHLSEDEKERRRVKEAYETYDGNASKIAKDSPYSIVAIIRYLRGEGFWIRKRGEHDCRISSETREQIIEYHSVCDIASRVAEEFGCSRNSVSRIWGEAGLSIRKPGRPRKEKEKSE